MLKNNHILISLCFVFSFICKAEDDLSWSLFGRKQEDLEHNHCFREGLEALANPGHISFMHASFFNPYLILDARIKIIKRDLYIRSLVADFMMRGQ